MITAKPHHFPINHLNLACEIWHAEAKGLPLLALHGWLDNAASFQPLMQHLTQHPVWAIDFPGHGLSDHLPPGASYHFFDALTVIDEVIAALGWREYGILGHSMGAGLASIYAAVAPAGLKQLVVIDTLGPLVEAPDRTAIRLQQSFREAVQLKQKTSRLMPHIDMAAKLRQKGSDLCYEHALLLVQRGTEQTPDGWRWRHDQRLFMPSFFRLTEEQSTDVLRAITVPSCLVYGEHGLFEHFPYYYSRFENTIPDLFIRKVAGGHHCHMELPETVAAHIQDFFATQGG